MCDDMVLEVVLMLSVCMVRLRTSAPFDHRCTRRELQPLRVQEFEFEFEFRSGGKGAFGGQMQSPLDACLITGRIKLMDEKDSAVAWVRTRVRLQKNPCSSIVSLHPSARGAAVFSTGVECKER